MTFPINYAAEVRASKARHEAKIAEAKKEFDAHYAEPRPRSFDVGGRPSTITRDRGLARVRARGMPPAEIARRTGMSVHAVRKAILRAKQAGEDVPQSRAASQRETIERNRRIIREFQAGASKAELAHRYGLTVHTVTVLLSRARTAGQPLRTERGGKAAPHAKPQRNRALYLAHIMGTSQAELARQHGLSDTVVNKIIARERELDQTRHERIVA